MSLFLRCNETFENIKNKKKMIELRINYGYIKNIKKNQILKINYSNKNVDVIVTDLIYFKNLSDVFEKICYSKILPDINNKIDAISYFDYLYPKRRFSNQIKKSGYVAIYIKII